MGSRKQATDSEIATTDYGNFLSRISESVSESYEKKSNKNSNSTTSFELMSKLLLNEDLRFHILTFVPLNSVLNSARYVCKTWAATIGSSLFTQAYKRRACFKRGIYVENCKNHGSSYFLELKDDVNGRFQFERTDLGTPQGMGNVISTCDGILLLMNDSREIFVVNPIFKSWLRIPPFPVCIFRNLELNDKCTITRVPGTDKFKLFTAHIVWDSGAYWNAFFVLRIGIDNSWKEIARKESYSFRNDFPLQLIYSGDNDIYWITKNEVILMDVKKEIIVGECPVPHRFIDRNPKYLMMGNRLSCIVERVISTTYHIYVLDVESKTWSLYHEMGTFNYVPACGHRLRNMWLEFRLWINDQIIYRSPLREGEIGFCYRTEKYRHFGYNVKTKQLTKIKDIFVGDFEVWPHTNSLVSLPS